jgi:hypothetical protein
LGDFDVIFNADDDSPLGRALRSCEIHCVSVCCGMNAFEVSPGHLQQWANGIDAMTLQRARDQLVAILAEIGTAPDTFYFLDTYHRRDEVLHWFEQIAASLAAAQALG